jgi:WD40 repeat protein
MVISFNITLGQVIASSGDDGKVALTFIPKAQVIETLIENQSMSIPIYSTAFSSYSQFVGTGSGDGVVRIWDLKTRSVKVKSHSHNELVCSVAWNLNDSILASGSMDGLVSLHSTDKQTPLATLNSVSHVRVVIRLGY